jgi:hypothetical protein
MEEKRIRALIKAMERLMGDPLRADTREVEALFAEFGEGKNPAESMHELASEVAQKYRLEGTVVPTHVAEALNFTKRALSGEATMEMKPESIIDAVLNPILGPVQQVSFAFRNRKECTAKDRELLEKLSGEVKKDWSGEK